MLLRKRVLRLAEKYGPFVRFFPEGSEGADETDDSNVSDDQAADDVINEAEPKVEDSPQFKGLLRDRQADRANLSHINAENAAYKQQNEKLQQDLAEARKPKDEAPQLSEEEAAQEVTRGEFLKTLHGALDAHGKKMLENVTKALNTRDANTKQANLKKNQTADAQALMRECTAKTKGLTLDAKTVVDEACAYLAANDPELLETLSKRPDFASKIYQLAPALVPSIKQRVDLRHNTILAKQLDQKGEETPGGGAPSSDELGVFEAILSSGEEMSDEALSKLQED